jgi:DNA-binding FadR family transcriptional regulator
MYSMAPVKADVEVSVRQPLSRQAEARLRQYVIDHGLGPGDPLPSEAELAQLLEMGKTSIREGVRSLETLGVVEVRHGRGIFVGRFSFDPLIDQLPYNLAVNDVPLRELLQVRRALEEGLVVEASKKLSGQHLDALDALVARMRDEGAHGAVPAEVDRAFHVALFEPLGNRLVMQLIEVFWAAYVKAAEHLHGVHAAARPGGLHTAEAHAAILRAIRSSVPAAMTAAVAEHFSDIQRIASEELDAPATTPPADPEPADA